MTEDTVPKRLYDNMKAMYEDIREPLLLTMGALNRANRIQLKEIVELKQKLDEYKDLVYKMTLDLERYKTKSEEKK